MMAGHWYYFFFILWFGYLLVSSILLFTKGFLLTKIAQEINSTCIHLAEIDCNDTRNICDAQEKLSKVLDNFEHSYSNVCLHPKARVVLLIVDALRYDFTQWDDSITKPLSFQNKLPIMNELRKEFPENTRLFRFIADPPTTTMQRLKALTTGSLPTFIDVSSNFATPEIKEDNIIDQVVRNNYHAVFMGDDTWNNLYPNRFLRSYPYPSFNVWDLDTVDDGIRTHLYDELKRDDWSLLVAHFLGVDHCGHRYGPYHPEMGRKLTEMNEVIKNVASRMDENTVLFVIGDHGMTTTGDHGGESLNEITSALFLYSKTPLYAPNISRESDSVKQIRLVPTLAAILGIPMPFSNLGTLILEAMPVFNKTESNNPLAEWKFFMHDLWSNARQIVQYIKEYSKNSDEAFSQKDLQNIDKEFSGLGDIFKTIRSEEDFLTFADKVTEFAENLRQHCEDAWTKFDPSLMSRGLLLTFTTMFLVYIITDGISHSSLQQIFKSSFIACSYGAVFFTTMLVLSFYYFGLVNDLLSSIFFYTGLVSHLMLAILVVQNWKQISINWYVRNHTEKLSNMTVRLVMVCYLCSQFSNSFIIEESFMLLFFLNTVILLAALSVSPVASGKKQTNFKSKLKLVAVIYTILICVRLSVFFWSCREEQQWCFENAQNRHIVITAKTESTKVQWLVTVICLGAFVTLSKIWLRNCGNLNGYSPTVFMAKYIPTVLVVCMSGYWVLDHLSPSGGSRLRQNNFLAWSVYFLAFLGIVTSVVKPLCVYLLPGKSDLPDTSPSDRNIIPQLFGHLKKLWSESNKDDMPVVCGFGTVYSAIFAILGIYVALVVALLHGDTLAPSVIIMCSTLAFVLVVMSVIRLEKVNSIDELFEVPDKYILIWVILSQYFFYGTGHQPTFPNILWNAAFVGTSEISNTQKVIPASLVIVNTFSSQLLLGFLLPLVLIWPFTLSLMMPSIVKKGVLNQDNVKGEVALFERKDLMMTSAFTITCKYVVIHGLRVFSSMLAATIHCRHLMVWNIFAPKFIFEGIGLLITLAMVVLSYLVLIQVNRKIESFVSNLLKKNR